MDRNVLADYGVSLGVAFHKAWRLPMLSSTHTSYITDFFDMYIPPEKPLIFGISWCLPELRQHLYDNHQTESSVSLEVPDRLLKMTL